MAALRYAARKFGGRALQRTQAAVEEDQRRLLPRLIHGRSRSTSSGAAQPPPNFIGDKSLTVDEIEAVRRLMEIHNKREELYNLSTEFARNYRVPYWTGLQNRKLRQNLSVQVDPRPDDPDWRWLRAMKIIDDFLGLTGAVVASCMVTYSLSRSSEEADPKEKKRNEQEQ